MMSFPDTITVRTPLTSNTLLQVGHSIVRSPSTASTLVFPFTAYLVSRSARDDTTQPTRQLITGSVTVAFPVVLFDVVEVYQLVELMKLENRFGLRKA